MKRLLFSLLFLVGLSWESAFAQGPVVEHLQQRRLEIAPGQYSGITHVADDVYAVVHDKARGGGLFFFTLQFLADGSIGSVSAFETDAGGAEGRDNEDVVFVPETQTLFVSAEVDQSIREYTLDGRETGRSLRIPKALKGCAPNAGFEALAYADGTFWTTTESPLPGETQHRLQSFSLRNLTAGKSWNYQADTPTVGETEAASAKAYVFGISAITALPDERLIVLEREVYVPGGGFFEMMGSFTVNSLFLIDPLHDRSKVLQKTLLTRFYTNFLNLANFEGMCLGPTLQDGRQTLLLLADSQDGSQGLTGEYIRVLALDIR